MELGVLARELYSGQETTITLLCLKEFFLS